MEERPTATKFEKKKEQYEKERDAELQFSG